MHMKPNHFFLAPTLLFSLGLVWGSGYAIARFAVTNGVHPLGYTFWQSLGPAVILALICMLTRQPLSFKSKNIFFYFICGLIGIAIPNTNMFYAAQHLPASLLALIVNTVPIMIYPMALLNRQEKFQWLRLFSVFCAIIGILFLILPKVSLPNFHQTSWIIFALITPFCFALFATYINPHRPHNSTPLSLAAGMMICSTLIISPLIISTHSFYPLVWPFSFVDWIIILEIGLSSLGYVLFFSLLKIAGSVYYSMVDGVVAMTGLFWGILLFGERFNRWEILAIIFILSAIGLMTWQQKCNNSF